MNEYHRTIVDFLRGHGARDVRLVPGGRHPHVEFLFRDKNFNLAVHNSPPGYSDAATIKVKELRAMLGDPDVAAPREARRLEDMTPRANGHAAPAAMGGVAMYKTPNGKLQLRMFPPRSAVDLLDAGAVRVERMARDTWLLSPDPSATRPRFYQDGKTWILSVGVAEEMTRGFDAPFGTTPAEYVEVDGKVMVRLLVDQIRPVAPRPKRAKRLKIDDYPSNAAIAAHDGREINPVQDAEPAIGATEVQGDAVGRTAGANPATGADRTSLISMAVPLYPWVEPTMPDPRAVLAAISKIEAATPYRLVKSEKSGWIWQAPTIRLGEGC